jgi:hypothetical protein
LFHIDKTKFNVPFVWGKGSGEALRRISEGASMIRTKGEPGTGDIIQAVRHMRMMMSQIRQIQNQREDELFHTAKELQVSYELVQYVHENGKLPVVNFAAGGVATPADAALMMQLGAEGVFVGSGIFKSGNPAKRAEAIVKSVTNFNNPALIAQLSEDLGKPWSVLMNRNRPFNGGARQIMIGVLALQGGFIEHIHALEKLDVPNLRFGRWAIWRKISRMGSFFQAARVQRSENYCTAADFFNVSMI